MADTIGQRRTSGERLLMARSGRRPKYRLSELAFDAYFSEEIDSCTGCNAGGKSAEGIADAKDHKGPYCFGAAVESGVHGFPTRYIHVRDRRGGVQDMR